VDMASVKRRIGILYFIFLIIHFFFYRRLIHDIPC
jgi:hypothetical protein